MNGEKRSNILSQIDSKTKVLALITLIAEGLFLGSLVKLSANQIIYALIICASILVISIIGIVLIELKGDKQSSRNDTPLPSTTAKAEEPTRVFEVDQAIDFYNQIAHKYDERNTDELLEMHRSVIHEIDKCITQNPNCKILDLGGGTGRLIATQFFDKDRITWTYVDQSTRMAEQFQKNMKGTKLKKEIIIEDISSACEKLQGKKFDIIVISCVLTSLPDFPDFSKIRNLIDQGGIVIVADIDPAYIAVHPHYSFKLNAKSCALKINLIHPLDIIEFLTREGLKNISSMSVKKSDGTNYSYVIVFST